MLLSKALAKASIMASTCLILGLWRECKMLWSQVIGSLTTFEPKAMLTVSHYFLPMVHYMYDLYIVKTIFEPLLVSVDWHMHAFCFSATKHIYGSDWKDSCLYAWLHDLMSYYIFLRLHGVSWFLFHSYCTKFFTSMSS